MVCITLSLLCMCISLIFWLADYLPLINLLAYYLLFKGFVFFALADYLIRLISWYNK